MKNFVKKRDEEIKLSKSLRKPKIINATEEEYYIYTKYIESRKFDSYNDIPLYIRKKIKKKIDIILDYVPDAVRIYLIGSYINGTYVDENTDDEFYKLRNKIKGKRSYSDFDFIVISEGKIGDLKEHNMDVIIKSSFFFPRENAIIVYDRKF